MNVAIIGGTSAIAIAFSRRRAERGDSLRLIARDSDRANAVCSDLRIRGAASATAIICDVATCSSFEHLMTQIHANDWAADVMLFAQGILPNQKDCLRDVDQLATIVAVNLTSVMQIALAEARIMSSKGGGTLVILGSVAGDRIRPSNFLYGTTKSALAAFCEGMRNITYARNVRAILVKPGMVRSAMTQHLKDSALFSDPETVAADIDAALTARRAVLYSPWIWRVIMAVVRHLPASIVRRM